MKISILVLCLLVAAGSAVWAGDVLLSLSLDWMFNLKLGVEVPLAPWFALRADLGGSFSGTIVGDLFAVLHAMPPSTPLRLALLVGVPNASIVPTCPPAGMVSFGGAILAGYRFTERFGMDLRVGAGFPLFFEEDRPMIQDLPDFPLGLWPDVTLSAFLRL